MGTSSDRDNGYRYFPFGMLLRDQAWHDYDTAAIVEKTGADWPGDPFPFAQMLASQMNARRDGPPWVRSGELHAMILLHEIFRTLMDRYTEDVQPDAFSAALDYARDQQGTDAVTSTLPAFVSYFPPLQLKSEEHVPPLLFLQGSSRGKTHAVMTLQEMLLVQLAHENQALASCQSLFDYSSLCHQVPLLNILQALDGWFSGQSELPGTGLSLLELLRAPLRASPDSLEGQLSFILENWRAFLPEGLIQRLLVVQGILREEMTFRGHGPGESKALRFAADAYDEPEAFTTDVAWMPQVVLLAKLAFVWLHQLSLRYNRPMHKLSDIPDEELDRIAGWGFNALWLIGVWERSSASRMIKQRMGNPEAAASAYSLYDYVIAEELGGEEAYQDLAHRARLRGIRLAGDMVPNHMGIHSKWITENPDRFLSLSEPPFPGYRFDGPDLSEDSRIGLFIEEGYWNHSDAAVVFKRVDRQSGEVRYIYHGNDGTSMPWNDTAQLNFMNAETREAVIRTILEVARRFPIIRFDAAMTLAKRHYQRLWFPLPGDGGAIPSRAAHGLEKPDFDALFPQEFWREVVDRVAEEVPDTLLLAEAFWLMEGYFVRTLGMHRVYNSAFMNMLKMEDNAKYRETIKNILEFSPEILQRFVNFMNNPDEDTAEAQFGKGDKYFGVATLLVTMPGLPMFGHGQIEGLSEKYGMEYRRAYKDEQTEDWLVERHEREIFPLMRMRHLFSGSTDFALFDLTTPEGWVDENVFAYTNRREGEAALVVYNNIATETAGVLHTSTAINTERGDNVHLVRRNLTEALVLNNDAALYTLWRDARSGLEYLLHNATVADQGWHLSLKGYESRIFIFARQILDHDGSWGKLCRQLGGQGVASVDEAYKEMQLAAILIPFGQFFTADLIHHVLYQTEESALPDSCHDGLTAFLCAAGDLMNIPVYPETILERLEIRLEKLRDFFADTKLDLLPDILRRFVEVLLPDEEAVTGYHYRFPRIAVAWVLLEELARSLTEEESTDTGRNPQAEQTAAAWMYDWLLIKGVVRAFEGMDGDSWLAWRDAHALSLSLGQRDTVLALEDEVWAPLLHRLFENRDMHGMLSLHWHGNRRWLNREQLNFALHTLFLINLLDADLSDETTVAALVGCHEGLVEILDAASDTGYDYDWMLSALK